MMKGELQNMLVLMSISGALVVTHRKFSEYALYCSLLSALSLKQV